VKGRRALLNTTGSDCRERAANWVDISYCITHALCEDAVSEVLNELSSEERERHARLVFEPDRRDFAAAHALLRRTLSAHENRSPAEWAFVLGKHGKPALAPHVAVSPPLCFSLSHTHGFVACAIGRGCGIGIDVERIDDSISALELAQQFFSPVEVAQIELSNGDERDVRFIEIWTLKEAYVKATGEGLSCPLDEFGFTFEGTGALRFHTSSKVNTTDWSFALFAPSPEYRMAVAVRGCGRRFRVNRVGDSNDRCSTSTNRPVRQTPSRQERSRPRNSHSLL
jgi:4'-phosphopantetheinyl transferase